MTPREIAYLLGVKTAAEDFGLDTAGEDNEPLQAFIQELDSNTKNKPQKIKEKSNRTDAPLWSQPVGLGAGDSYERNTGGNSLGIEPYGGV